MRKRKIVKLNKLEINKWLNENNCVVERKILQTHEFLASKLVDSSTIVGRSYISNFAVIHYKRGIDLGWRANI